MLTIWSAAIYKSERTQLNHFLESTRSVLHDLAGHAQEIEGIIQVNIQASVQAMSRGTRHVILLYHQVCCQLHNTQDVMQ